MKTVACIVGVDANVFDWLGCRPVLRWISDKLPEIRGLDDLVCLVSRKTADKVVSVLGDDFGIVQVPSDVHTDDEILRWACTDGPGKDADCLMLIRPCAPFVTAARMEECLDVVRSKTFEWAMTVRRIDIVDSTADNVCSFVRQAVSVVNGVKVVRPSLFRTGCGKWPRALAMIHVEHTESIDVTERGGLALAHALVDTGVV